MVAGFNRCRMSALGCDVCVRGAWDKCMRAGASRPPVPAGSWFESRRGSPAEINFHAGTLNASAIMCTSSNVRGTTQVVMRRFHHSYDVPDRSASCPDGRLLSADFRADFARDLH